MIREKVLEISGLKTWFHTPEGVARSVDGESFTLRQSETLALVGESGSGKSVTALSLMRLLDKDVEISADTFVIDGVDAKELSSQEARQIRGRKIAMIFQDPMTALNPVMKIRKQLGEVLKHRNPQMKRAEVRKLSIRALENAGVPNPAERLHQFPHQLSGGLRQRVMIAIALANHPKILIADEPTTALDVTIQAQIIDLLKKYKQERQMSMLLITHDFGVVSRLADRVAVMYAGEIVEEAPIAEIFNDPWHPYTELLIHSIPGIYNKRGQPFDALPGEAPDPLQYPTGCRFHPRCPKAIEICKRLEPQEYSVKNRRVSCWLKGGHDEQGNHDIHSKS